MSRSIYEVITGSIVRTGILVAIILISFPRVAAAGDFDADIIEIRKKLSGFESAKNASKSGTMSDEEFLEVISSIEETEKLIKTGTFNERSDTFKFRTEVGSTNRKPGYLLLNNEQDYDYEMLGFVTKLTYTPGRRTAVEAGFTRNAISEYGTNQVDIQRIDLALAAPLFFGFMTNITARSVQHSRYGDLGEFGAEVSRRTGGFDAAIGMSRNVYTASSSIYGEPPAYNRLNMRLGTEIAGEFYLELSPAYEKYLADDNYKREIGLSALYFPMGLSGFSSALYYTWSGFAYECDADGFDYPYFSPSRSGTAGLGFNYSLGSGRAKMNLGLNLERNDYSLSGQSTSYYAASAMSGLNYRFGRHVTLNANYGCSVARTSGFPFTQNLRLNTDIKF